MENFFGTGMSREDLENEIVEAICALATGVEIDDVDTQRRIAGTLVSVRVMLKSTSFTQ